MEEGGFELFVHFAKVLRCPNKSKEEKKYPTSRKLFKLFDELHISTADKVSLWPGCQEHDIAVAPGQCGPTGATTVAEGFPGLTRTRRS